MGLFDRRRSKAEVAEINQRKDAKEAEKVQRKAHKEPFMRKYGPDSPYRGPGRVLQLVGLDKAANKFVNRQYSDLESTYSDNEALINLKLDQLRILGYDKEVSIIEAVRDKKRKKDKAYFQALNIINKK